MKNKKNTHPRKQKSSCIPDVRVPKDYHWKVLKKLTFDLQKYISEEDFRTISTIVRDQDVDGYLKLSDAWDLQSIGSLDIPLMEMRAKLSISALLRKFDFPGDRKQRIEKAIQGFHDAECACFWYNQIGWRRLSWADNDLDVAFNTYIQQFIRKVIGDEPQIENFDLWMRHGPGSTTQTSGPDISSYWKFSNWPYDVTAGAKNYAVATIKNDERWLGALEDSYRERNKIPKHHIIPQETFWADVFNIVDGSKVTTVPKTARTERMIAIEPTLNLYLQLGVDGYIRRRLKRYGVNLDCQAKNQELARRGSVSGDFTTLDLSAASDSISLRLVRQIFPSQWFSVLDDLRSHYGSLGSELYEFEKLSSMGNGFTFAVESLIFAAIVYAATRISGNSWNKAKCAIFGDDIVVESKLTNLVIHGLKLCGFKLNHSKSFFKGPCRESCGADWSSGFDVRPVFLKERPRSIKNLLSDINRLKRKLDLWYSIEDPTVCLEIKRWLPSGFKTPEGPYSDEEFDTYLHSLPIMERYKGCVFHFARLVSIPIESRGPTSFLFRKLMNALNVSTSKSRTVKSGNSFAIVARNKVRNAIVPASHTDNWCDRYSSYVPAGPSMLDLA